MQGIFSNPQFGDEFKTNGNFIVKYINERPHGRYNLYCPYFNKIYTVNCNGVPVGDDTKYKEFLSIDGQDKNIQDK